MASNPDAAPGATAAVAPPLLKYGATTAFRVADVRDSGRAFLSNMAELLADVPTELGSELDASDLRLQTEEAAVAEALSRRIVPVPRSPLSQQPAAPVPPKKSTIEGAGPGEARPRRSSARTAVQQAEQHAAAVLVHKPEDIDQRHAPETSTIAAATGGPGEAGPSYAAVQQAEQQAAAVLVPLATQGQQEGFDLSITGAAAVLHQAEKLAVQQAHDATVAAVRQQRAAARAEAAQTLRTVREVATEETGTDQGLRWRRKKGLLAFGLAPQADPTSTVEGRARQLQRIAQAAQHAARGGGRPSAAVPKGEVVLHVAIHIPQAPAHVSEEWLVLGSQRLTELCDVLYCLTAVNVGNVEREENERRTAARQPPLHLLKPSAYFYVEGTFYNDMRRPGAVDCSEPIRRYNMEHGVRAPPHPVPAPASSGPRGALVTDFSCASMGETRFEDLWLRLGAGAPGVYCHQGGCEHVVVFRDVRLHDPDADPQLLNQYPFKLSSPGMAMVHHRQCEACCIRAARCVTENDVGAPRTPFFWCDECFKSLHYDLQGRALYTDFRVFPYTHDYQSLLMHMPGRKAATS